MIFQIKIEYHRDFWKLFKKVPVKIQKQFVEKIMLFANKPFDRALNNHSVDPAYSECSSINITGDWRAIFYMRQKDIAVFIKIGTHSQLYK